MKRDHYFARDLGLDYTDPETSWADPEDRVMVEPGEDFNLVGSTVGRPVGWHGGSNRQQNEEVMHMPVLDVDHQCYLLPSPHTPGHFHLYIDVPMPWSDYEKLLTVMGEVGILEPGYVSASIARKATFVAPKPWKDRDPDG